jgi:TolB-like protein
LESIEASPASSRWPVGLAAVAGAALLGLGAWWTLRSPDAADRHYDSIAVLPFVNMSGEEADEYLGDGLAEELLNSLVRIEGLKVASRTSAFAFKGTAADTRTIADSLNVQAVLEGSIRRSGDNIRVTAQLIAGEDGFHLWSESYDQAAGNLLEITDEVAEQIMLALAVQLAGDEPPRTASQATENEAAYDYFLQGRYFWNKRSAPDMAVAIGLFEKAIEADSGFAPAYAAIADAYVVPSGWADGVTEALDRAEEYASLALQADPTLAQAHATLGLTYLNRDLAFARSDDAFQRSIELDSMYASAHQWYAEVLVAAGRHEEAVESARRAASLDPTEIIRWSVARMLYFSGRYDEALEQLDLSAELEGRPGREPLLSFLTSVNQGDYEAILAMLETMAPAPLVAGIRDSLAVVGEDANGPWFRRWFVRFVDNAPAPDGSVDLGWPSLVVRMALEPDSVWVHLETLDPENGDDRYSWLNVLADATFDPLRADPRFAEIHARFEVIGMSLDQ